MQYFGGKSKTGKLIGEVLNAQCPLVYYEPFCGGLWVTQYVRACEYVLSDNNPYLIKIYQSIMAGWKPPGSVDETEYQWYKMNQDPNDPMTAFVGIGCSFGGKWFGGYARGKQGWNNPAKYAGQAKRSLEKKFANLTHTHAHTHIEFNHMNFSALNPIGGSLVYCDPPYAGTENGYSSEALDFWEVMRRWSTTCTVIISEYKAPDDFRCIAEFPTSTSIRSKNGREARVEKLFMRF